MVLHCLCEPTAPSSPACRARLQIHILPKFLGVLREAPGNLRRDVASPRGLNGLAVVLAVTVTFLHHPALAGSRTWSDVDCRVALTVKDADVLWINPSGAETVCIIEDWSPDMAEARMHCRDDQYPSMSFQSGERIIFAGYELFPVGKEICR
jgi:hypothetical protein